MDNQEKDVGKYKNRLVKFIDEREHNKYGICQFLGEGTTSYTNRSGGRMMFHYSVINSFYVFRTGKEIGSVVDDINSQFGLITSGYSSDIESQPTAQYPSIPQNFFHSIKTKTENRGNHMNSPISSQIQPFNQNIPHNLHNLNNPFTPKTIEIKVDGDVFPLLPKTFLLVDENQLKSSFPINDLPNTVWPIILSFFKVSELPQIMTVCKKWKQHFDNDLHWKQRTKREITWKDEKFYKEKASSISWKQFYLNQDWEISINETSNNQIHNSHKIKISPNAAVCKLVQTIKKSVKNFSGEPQTFNSIFQFECAEPLKRDAFTVRETGLKSGSTLSFQYRPHQMYCD